MLKTTVEQFFPGPSRWSAHAGLLLELRAAPETLAFLRGTGHSPRTSTSTSTSTDSMAPSPAGSMATLARTVRLALPSLPDATQDRADVLSLMLSMATCVTRDVCVAPGACRLLAAQSHRLLVFLPCDEHETGSVAWSFAMELPPLLDALRSVDPAAAIAHLAAAHASALKQVAAHALPADMLTIVRAAARQGIPHTRIGQSREFVQLGQGRRARRIADTATDLDSCVASFIARGTWVLKSVLQSHGLPVPVAMVCPDAAAAWKAARRIGFPVTLRPLGKAEGQSGRGLIADEASFGTLVGRMTAGGRSVAVEPRVDGADHDLLVVGGACISVSRSGRDVTAATHADNLRLAEHVARVVGLKVAGVRLCTADIGRSWRTVPAAIAAVKATPELGPHAGAPQDPGDAFVSHLFAGAAPARVPTAGITGSMGKTTTCRLVAAVLAQAGHKVGLSTTQGAWVGTELVRSGDMAGGMTASNLLLDPTVEAGVFEFARGGLLQRGSVLDAVDVGAVLNVTDHHVGHEGLATQKELAQVKRLVVEIARQGAVLNADDPLCMAMRAHVKAPVTLVSMSGGNPDLLTHLAAGGRAAWHDSGLLRLRRGQADVGALAVADVPTTFQGRFRPAIWHALFAMAICDAMGIAFDVIARALTAFVSTPRTNPGRMNFYEGLPFQLLVSHAAGGEGMAELRDFVQGVACAGEKILLICAAGNRTDDYVLDVGRFAAGAFTRYICCDSARTRDRAPGEVAQLLRRGLMEGGVDAGRITATDTLDDGVRLAYASVRPGDLLVENTFSNETMPGWLRFRGLAAARAPA